MSVSTDGGGSWGPVRFVNQDGAVRTSNHFTPAVAAHDGTVLIAYRSRKEGSVRVEVRCIVSSDGGGTFGRERRLGRLADTRLAATAGTDAFFGDYMGLALSADAAHAVWCSSSRARPGATHHQTTWNATIVR